MCLASCAGHVVGEGFGSGGWTGEAPSSVDTGSVPRCGWTGVPFCPNQLDS